jgi:hypothetical protein
MPAMESGTVSTSQGRGGVELGKRIGLIVVAIVVTIFIVLFILNFQRWVSIDLIVGSVRTRVVWALLIPFGVGIILGFIGGRFKIRS